MTKLIKSMITGSAFAAALLLCGGELVAQTTKQEPAKTAAKAVVPPAATDKEIADAKAKGLVWVNLNSKVYHKDGQFYGKTKQGKFLTEAEAQKAGYHSAKEPAVGKQSASPGKK